MRTLSADLLSLIVVFRPLFTKPTWENAKALLLGVLLARGKRTVTACLRVVGLSHEGRFQNYHRVLNRAKWSAVDAARILLGRPWALPFFTALCPAGIEGQPPKVSRYRIRRRARKSKMWKSRAKTIVKKEFVAGGKTARQHKTAIDILMTMIRLAHRWMPGPAHC